MSADTAAGRTSAKGEADAGQASSEALRDSICAAITNRKACARAFEHHLLSTSGGARRDDSTLSIPLLRGDTLTLRDSSDAHGGVIGYSYRGRVRQSQYHLVELQFYEGGGYLLINERSGWKTFSNGVPIASPDGERLAAGNVDLEAEFSPTTIQVWRVAADTLVLEWEHDLLAARAENDSVWGPGGLRWTGPAEIVVTKEYLFGVRGEDTLLRLTPQWLGLGRAVRSAWRSSPSSLPVILESSSFGLLDMRTPFELIALAACSLALAGAARDPTTPVSDAVRSAAARAERNFLTAAEYMPAGMYGFKPTEAQMTFGEVIAHMAGGNDALCSSIGGVPAPKRPGLGAGASKETLVARLRETFRFCETALSKVNDSKLEAMVPYFGSGENSQAAAMVAAAEEWSGHYSQIAVYLRLKGLLPPTARPKPA